MVRRRNKDHERTARRPKKGVYQFSAHLAVVVLLLIFFVLVGYFYVLSPEVDESNDVQALALATSQAAWQRERPAAFRYVVESSCFGCDASRQAAYRVIENGRSLRTELLVSSTPAADAGDPLNPISIERAFEIVGQAVAAGSLQRVDYHPSYGFPTEVELIDTGQAAGSIQSFRLSEFVVLSN